MFAPKLGGLAATAAALQRQPVASLALFSSVASLLGAAGQVRGPQLCSVPKNICARWTAGAAQRPLNLC